MVSLLDVKHLFLNVFSIMCHLVFSLAYTLDFIRRLVLGLSVSHVEQMPSGLALTGSTTLRETQAPKS